MFQGNEQSEQPVPDQTELQNSSEEATRSLLVHGCALLLLLERDSGFTLAFAFVTVSPLEGDPDTESGFGMPAIGSLAISLLSSSSTSSMIDVDMAS